MKDLISILEEEIDIISDDSNVPPKDVQAMRRALAKLNEGNYTLTDQEKSAVRYALEDIGELYLHAGTSAGFDADIVDDIPKAQRRARSALMQARRLGVSVRGG